MKQREKIQDKLLSISFSDFSSHMLGKFSDSASFQTLNDNVEYESISFSWLILRRKTFVKLFHLRSSSKESVRLLWRGMERKSHWKNKFTQNVCNVRLEVLKTTFSSFFSPFFSSTMSEGWRNFYKIILIFPHQGCVPCLIDVRKSIFNLFWFYWWTSDNFSVETFHSTAHWNEMFLPKVIKRTFSPVSVWWCQRTIFSIKIQNFSHIKQIVERFTFHSDMRDLIATSVVDALECFTQISHSFASFEISMSDPTFSFLTAAFNKSWWTASAKHQR